MPGCSCLGGGSCGCWFYMHCQRLYRDQREALPVPTGQRCWALSVIHNNSGLTPPPIHSGLTPPHSPLRTHSLPFTFIHVLTRSFMASFRASLTGFPPGQACPPLSHCCRVSQEGWPVAALVRIISLLLSQILGSDGFAFSRL